jgi:hypothetical protein
MILGLKYPASSEMFLESAKRHSIALRITATYHSTRAATSEFYYAIPKTTDPAFFVICDKSSKRFQPIQSRL